MNRASVACLAGAALEGLAKLRLQLTIEQMVQKGKLTQEAADLLLEQYGLTGSTR